jgi:GNAT superfamily N-acetyltransferase
MADMLVKLYELPDLEPVLNACRDQGVAIRVALSPERGRVLGWMDEHFAFWAREVEGAYARFPVTCFLAVREHGILGFACYDSICRNFFGPTGVLESERRKGIGRALLLASLHALKAQGYGYAIIGGVGPAEYYAKAVGATLIEGSTPGVYRGLLF